MFYVQTRDMWRDAGYCPPVTYHRTNYFIYTESINIFGGRVRVLPRATITEIYFFVLCEIFLGLLIFLPAAPR